MTFAMLMSALGPPSAKAHAQVMPGETVRVRLISDQEIEGVVLSSSPSLLELREVEGAVLELEWREVREVARRRLHGNTWRGLWIGALAGGVVAGTLAGVTWEPCTALCIGPEDRGGTIALAAVLGGAAGGLVGLGIGTLIKSPSWEIVVAPSVSAGPSPNQSAALRLGLRWALH